MSTTTFLHYLIIKYRTSNINIILQFIKFSLKINQMARYEKLEDIFLQATTKLKHCNKVSQLLIHELKIKLKSFKCLLDILVFKLQIV